MMLKNKIKNLVRWRCPKCGQIAGWRYPYSLRWYGIDTHKAACSKIKREKVDIIIKIQSFN